MKELARVFSYTKHLRSLLIFVTIVSIINTVMNLLMPFVIKDATDTIVAITTGKSATPPVSVMWYAVILLVIALATAALGNIGGYFGDVLATRMREQLSNRYYEHLLTLPQRYFDDELTGTIINRLN